jgi:hypothetical protein
MASHKSRIRRPRGKLLGMARYSTSPEMTEEEMAVLILQAQDEERLGQVVRCDDEGELRKFFADIHAQRE